MAGESKGQLIPYVLWFFLMKASQRVQGSKAHKVYFGLGFSQELISDRA